MSCSPVLQRWRLRGNAVASGWLCALLVLALLLAQTLGTWHAIVHPSHAHHSNAHAGHSPFLDGLLAHLHEEDGEDHEGILERLFSSHHDESDCRMFDQLSHGDVLVGVPLHALPMVVAPFLLLLMSGLAKARWHALFQARGPPLVR